MLYFQCKFLKFLSSFSTTFFASYRFGWPTPSSDQRMDTINCPALPCPCVYVLVDGHVWLDCQSAFDDQVNTLIRSGVGLIQFRDKRLSDLDHVVLGKRLTELTRDTPTRWIMNDRVDLAIATGADGVHLGQDDLSPTTARAIIGAGKLIGRSTHSLQQARDAVAAGADYIGVGPVFESQTKHFTEFVGVDLVSAVAREINVPAFAIGGVNLDNVSQIRDAGLNRVAVSAVVNQAATPNAVVKQLLTALQPNDRASDQ